MLLRSRQPRLELCVNSEAGALCPRGHVNPVPGGGPQGPITKVKGQGPFLLCGQGLSGTERGDVQR